MVATLLVQSMPAAAPLGENAGVTARLAGWIRKSRDARCVTALDPRLAADAGLPARFHWRAERDCAAATATEACGDRRIARQVLELDHPGVLADFQQADRS